MLYYMINLDTWFKLFIYIYIFLLLFILPVHIYLTLQTKNCRRPAHMFL